MVSGALHTEGKATALQKAGWEGEPEIRVSQKTCPLERSAGRLRGEEAGDEGQGNRVQSSRRIAAREDFF